LSEKATAEAIHVAQQSGDPACVAHALSLLYQSTGNRDILEKCAVRALQAKLRRLMAGAHCALAQTASTHQEAWELLLDATTDKPSLTVDRPTHMQDLSSPEEAMEIMGQISLTSADIWETMGFQGMSALITEIALECFGDRITSEVKAMAVQNLARKLLSGPLLVDNEQGLSRYGLALQTVKEQGNAFGTCLLLQEWAVRRGEYGHAKALLDYLHSRLHPGMPNYKLAKLQVGTQEAMFLSRQGWIKEAKAKLHGLIKKCQEEKWISQQANLLIQLAVTQLDANRHEFRGVIQPTRDCLKLTRDHSMDVLYATAQSIMAQIHYRMSSTNRAIAMLKGCMPTLHQNGHVWFVGEAYLTLAKCYLKNESLELALGSLNKSGDFFTQCQDFVRLREVYYLKANIYNTMDDIDQREEMSARFVDISRQLAKGTVPSGLGQIEDHDFLDHMTKRQVHATAR
jgi:tetratricopeptide (TPR) repeat protein